VKALSSDPDIPIVEHCNVYFNAANLLHRLHIHCNIIRAPGHLSVSGCFHMAPRTTGPALYAFPLHSNFSLRLAEGYVPGEEHEI
jgi:hypothetical protein